MSKEKKKITLIAEGDRELWVVEDEGWSLPVYVDTVKDTNDRRFAFVTRACNYKASWFEAMNNKLSPLSIDTEGQWIIPLKDFKKLAKKANGVTPSFYIVWNHQRMFPQNAVKYRAQDVRPEREDTMSFIQFMAEENDIFSEEQLALMFTLFKSCFIKWVLFKRKVLDLGPVKLMALPFRANWKQMIDAWISPTIFKLPNKQKQEALVECGFDNMLTNLRLLAMDVRTIQWGIECVTTDEWYKNHQYYEHARLTGGNDRYFDHVHDSMCLVRPQAIEAYQAWVKEKAAKTGYLAQGGKYGNKILCPNPSLSERNPDNCPRCQDYNPVGLRSRRPRRRKGSLVSANENLQEVPVVQQQP